MLLLLLQRNFRVVFDPNLEIGSEENVPVDNDRGSFPEDRFAVVDSTPRLLFSSRRI